MGADDVPDDDESLSGPLRGSLGHTHDGSSGSVVHDHLTEGMGDDEERQEVLNSSNNYDL